MLLKCVLFVCLFVCVFAVSVCYVHMCLKIPDQCLAWEVNIPSMFVFVFCLFVVLTIVCLVPSFKSDTRLVSSWGEDWELNAHQVFG